MQMQWISSKEAIDALGISKQAFYKARDAKKFRYKNQVINGCQQYSVLLTDLPPDVQERYWSAQNVSAPVSVPDQSDADIYATAPEYARKKADRYLSILNQCGSLTGAELKRFIAQWNVNNPKDTTSYPRVIEARKQYEQGGVAALLGQWGKRSGSSSVDDSLYAVFKSLYLKEGRPSVMSCWKITLGHASENGFDTTNFPSHMAFIRRLEKDIPTQAIYTARNGAWKANKKYGYYIKRDYDDMLSGECWVSDHAQVDIAVSYVKDGQNKYGFPWVTVWRDFKSGKWLGWDIHMEDPYSDHIFQSFHRAASDYGIPQTVYLDNGKDYRCRDFAGGRRTVKLAIDTNRATSLTAALGIKTIYAWPYNAQAKPVERDFLRNKEWFSKHDSAYRGGCIAERPESLNDVIKAGNLMSFEEFSNVFQTFITDVINVSVVSSGHRKNQCPNEMFDNEIQTAINAGKVRKISKQALMLFCTRTSTALTIGRRGIHDSELDIDYYSDWLEGCKGKFKVYLRRDPKRMQEAYVFKAENDEYLGQAFYNPTIPAIAESDISRSDLKQQIAIKRSSNKIHKTFATADIDNMTTQQKMNLLGRAQKLVNDSRGYIPQNNMCFPEVDATKMDGVMTRKKELEKEGLQDFSVLGLHRQKKIEKKKLIAFESDREQLAVL